MCFDVYYFVDLGSSIFYPHPHVEGQGNLKGWGRSLKAVSEGATVSVPSIFYVL